MVIAEEDTFVSKLCPRCHAESLIREGDGSISCLLCAWRNSANEAIDPRLPHLGTEETLADIIIKACRTSFNCGHCWRRRQCEELFAFADGIGLAELLGGKDIERADRRIRQWQEREELQDERCRRR